MTNDFDKVSQRGVHFGMIPYWLNDLSDRAVRVYWGLTRYINLPDGARPSASRVADDIKRSQSYVERGIKELREARVILVHQRWDGDRQLPSHYELAFTKPFDESEVPAVKRRTGGAVKSAGTPTVNPAGTVPSDLRDEVDTLVTHTQVDTDNYSAGKPASASNHIQPPLMQAVQGQSKDAPEGEGDTLSTPRDLRHRNGDTVSDRVVRWVGIANGFQGRADAEAWLRVNYPDGWATDYGDDGSDWVGALRRLIVGFDGVRAHNDGELRGLLASAEARGGLSWLVEYVQDAKWARVPA